MKPIQTLSAYIEQINLLYAEIEKNRSIQDPKALFFRGHSRLSHKLLPTALREGGKKIERGHLLNYRDNMPRHSRDYDYIRQRPEIITDMQHYGMKTRLLDWTFAPLTALFFALSGDCGDENSEVIVLNPWEYRSKLFGELERKHPSGQEVHVLGRALLSTHSPEMIRNVVKAEFYGACLTDDDLRLPFPFVAKYGNERLIHQSGCFTIHGESMDAQENHTPLDCFSEINSNPLLMRKIPIQRESRAEMMKELNRLFVNPYSIYPDLEGMSKHLKEYRSLYSIGRSS